MSDKSLAADLCRAARHARGKQASLTRNGRDQALARFARFLWVGGYQIFFVCQLKEKHVKAWAEGLAARGLSKRTIANNLAHIRTALEGIGRRPFADKMSNTALGVGGASRKGTKLPMAREDFEAFRAAAATVDPGVAIAIELQLELGLRAKEAVQSVNSLTDWLRALENPIGDGYLLVMHGTKGGKTRRSPPLDALRAADVIRRAASFAREHRGCLVQKPSLKQAMGHYHYVARKVGMTGKRAPHSLRYAYACEHLQRLKAAGVSRREAAAGVSTWLGHGDGRGTWVELVYGRPE
jgi:integrase